MKLNIKDISYYDFGPTILDLIGIKNYQPDFPFGRSIYLNSTDHSKFCINSDCIKKHEKPDANDLSFIYKFLHFERGRNIVQRYNLSKLFPCRINGTNDFYYSKEPCSTQCFPFPQFAIAEFSISAIFNNFLSTSCNIWNFLKTSAIANCENGKHWFYTFQNCLNFK